MSSMLKIRAKIVQCWIDGIMKQVEIAEKTKLPQGSISRIIEDITIVGWQDSWLNELRGC